MSDKPDPNDFVGPQQATPFDNMSPEQLAAFERASAIANGVKLYKSAGGAGVGAQWAPYAQELAKRGGLTQEEALNLARYRMWKQGMPVPNEVQPELTPDQIAARRNAFLQGTPQQRAAMMDEDKRAIFNAHQKFYDDLVMPKKAPPAPEPQPEAAIDTQQQPTQVASVQ